MPLPAVLPSARHTSPTRPRPTAMLAVALTLLAGCAFDVVSVKQEPVAMTLVSETPVTFVLAKPTEVSIGSGFTTRLRSETRWVQVGTIGPGQVFKTADQVVTVEASNIHEAQLVVSHDQIVGFYLPVEKTFTPAKAPIPLVTQPANPKT